MMISALLSFLGGNVFRMLWGEVSAMLTARQEHKHELDRLRLQAELDAAQHARNLESIKQQADLGVREISIKSEAAIGEIEAQGWLAAVKGTTDKIGVAWVDAWNGMIRPAVASWSVLMITGHYIGWWALDDNGWSVCGCALGIYLADRSLFKRGK